MLNNTVSIICFFLISIIIIIVYTFDRQERRVYYKHRYKARRFPDKYLTVIDDGMDQKTTNIPRVRRKTKATCNLTYVGTHLVGAVLHSGQSTSGKDIYGSFDFYQWLHDPNLTASVLLNMIAKWCQFYKLPPIFYLQLDNCVKENKNQYMMWLFALLVELIVFDKVSPHGIQNHKMRQKLVSSFVPMHVVIFSCVIYFIFIEDFCCCVRS